MSVVNLYEGNLVAGELAGEIMDVINSRSSIDFCTVIGALEVVKMTLLKTQVEKML